jgi:hypothetical protein
MRSRSSGVDGGRGRLLDDLLVAPLDRAVALAEVDDVAVAVAEHLDLDVAAVHDGALEDQLAAAERGLGLGAGRGDRGLQLGRRLTRRMPRPPPPAAALMSRGNPTWWASADQALVGLVGAVLKARDAGDAGGDHGALGGGLVAHRGDRGGARADEHEAGVDAGLRELGVLRQEAVAGVDRVGAGGPRGGDQALAVEVRVADGGGPIITARSARRTWGAPSSAWLYTATVR